jgi:hypothetical protein
MCLSQPTQPRLPVHMKPAAQAWLFATSLTFPTVPGTLLALQLSDAALPAGGMWPLRRRGLKNVEGLSMKRLLLSALMLGVCGLTIGCDGETTKSEVKTTNQTPTGSETKTVTEKDKKTGDAKDTAAPKAP